MKAILDGSLKVINIPKNEIYAKLIQLGIQKEIYTATKLSNVSKDEITELQEKLIKIQNEISIYNSKTGDDLWYEDLEEFETEYIRRMQKNEL